MRGTTSERPVSTAPPAVAFEPPPNLETLLARIAELSARLSRSVLASGGESEEADQARVLARYTIGARRRRDAHLAGLGMNEVQWMLLVELFVAEADQRSASVTEACQGVSAPKTTALRHLERLTEIGFVRRISHPTDKRSSHVEMTERGRALVATHFASEALRLRMSGLG